MEYGDEYEKKLERMRNRLVDTSEAYMGVAGQLIQTAGQAAIAISQEVQRHPNRAIDACERIQKKGIAQTALDSAKLSGVAQERFADAYNLHELLENLEEIVDNLHGRQQ